MMKLKSWFALFLVFAAFHVFAGDPPKKEMSAQEKELMEAWAKFATPGASHKLLDRMVGTFDAKVSTWNAPGTPPQVSAGTSDRHWILGGRYVEEKFVSTFMDQPFEGVGHTGYDNGRKQFFSTWLDNLGTGIMMSTGSASSDGKTLTFKSTYTDAVTGKEASSEVRVTFNDAEHETMEMWGPGADGKNFKMMEIAYTRKK